MIHGHTGTWAYRIFIVGKNGMWADFQCLVQWCVGTMTRVHNNTWNETRA